MYRVTVSFPTNSLTGEKVYQEHEYDVETLDQVDWTDDNRVVDVAISDPNQDFVMARYHGEGVSWRAIEFEGENEEKQE